ncbi:MAG: hypothetical protein P8Y71_27180 [Pseudolabrys sp.]|jgi:hypothetical protein
MRGFAGYLLIGGLAVVGMGVVTLAGLGFTVGARPVTNSGQVIQYVDRTHKGDRLDLHTTIKTESRRLMQPLRTKPARMPVGCEPMVSPLAASADAHRSGRCLAEFSPTRVQAG